MKILLKRTLFAALAGIALTSGVTTAFGATLNFNFTIDEPCFTTAGAYKPDGTLVNTIWRKVRYTPGSYSASWGGTNDDGTAVSPGTYEIRVLQNTMRYVWDGAIGNSSAEKSGRTVHRGFYAMTAMTIAGTKGFYCSGYNEGDYAFHAFNTADPQRTTQNFSWRLVGGNLRNVGGTIADQTWRYAANDGTWVYFACPAGWNVGAGNNSSAGWIVASQVSDSMPATFTSGQQVQADNYNPPTYWPSAVVVGNQAGLSGLAVQSSGNALAASLGVANTVYVYNKRSGALIRTFVVTNPQGLAFAPNGDLWVISGANTVRRYSNPEFSAPTIQATISGLSNVLAVAVHPADNNNVIVADGGGRQQAIGYNSAGQQQWTLGLFGGQPGNGPTVNTNIFWFQTRNIGAATCIAFQPDGSFWLGDPGNYRSLHFSAGRAFIEEIMFTDHGYTVTADPANPSRVFHEFLEFSVDYNKPLAANNGSWKLVRNWGASVPANFWGFRQGFKTVQTLSGRTYGLISDFADTERRNLVELSASGNLRFTGIVWDKDYRSLERDGSIRRGTNENNVTKFYEKPFTGIDGSGNPTWGAEGLKASASAGPSDPVPAYVIIAPLGAPVTANGTVISFNSTLENRMHLGGITSGGGAWRWRAAPSVTSNVPLDGLGSYDIGDSITYAGSIAMAHGRHVLYGFNGEFYRNMGQANQFMHYFEDGLFIGQFGEESTEHRSSELDEGAIPGFAGNSFSPVLVSTNGELYLWHNDEWGHGAHRWHLVGANSVRELSGSGNPGGATISVGGPVPSFPTRLQASGGNGSVQLNWNAASGATGYKVKWATTDGGPYVTQPDIVSSNSVLVGGLTNGVLYYFVVSALNPTGESAPSGQAQMRPFDPSIPVHVAGRVDDWRQVQKFHVDSAAPAAGRPSLYLNYYKNDMVLPGIGSKGYRLFNFGGAGSDQANVQSPFTVTKGSGWRDDEWLQQTFMLNGVESTRWGLYANPSGGININVSDNNFHYLTVFSPARFNDTRNYTVKLTPQGQSSPAATYAVNSQVGYSSMFQFVFKGNVTLTVDSPGNQHGTVKAIFLDSAGGSLPPPPAAPTGLVATPGSGQVSLSWNASSGATGYNVKRSTTSGSGYQTIGSTSGTSFPDTTVSGGTTYYYVVSAVNLGGESANSNEASATPSGGGGGDPILSQGRPVVVSSTDPCCPGSGAVDGNSTTRWSSVVGIDPQWIYVDLGAVYTISRVRLDWEWSYAVSYKIQVSMDGVNWYDAWSTTSGAGGVVDLNLDAAGRYVRMYGTQRSGPGGYSLWEFQVFGRAPFLLSQGRPVAASSVDTTHVAANAVDGNLTGTRWSSAMGSDPQWIYVDTGAIQTVTRAKLIWEAAYATSYKVQVSSDLSNWQDLFSTTSGTGGTVDIPLFGAGRYVRMYGTARGTPWGYSLWEFQIYR